MLYHEPVPDVHASLEIGRSKNQLVVGAVPDPLIPAAVGSRPVFSLIGARDSQEQSGIGMIRPEGEYFLRSQRIKPQRAAAHKPAVTLPVTPGYGILQAPADFRDPLRVNPAVAGKAYGILFSSRCSASCRSHISPFSGRQGMLRWAPGRYRTGASVFCLPSAFPAAFSSG